MSKNSLGKAYVVGASSFLGSSFYNFLKKKNISISPANINVIVNKCNGDRETLFNELKKIDDFLKKSQLLTELNWKSGSHI